MLQLAGITLHAVQTNTDPVHFSCTKSVVAGLADSPQRRSIVPSRNPPALHRRRCARSQGPVAGPLSPAPGDLQSSLIAKQRQSVADLAVRICLCLTSAWSRLELARNSASACVASLMEPGPASDAPSAIMAGQLWGGQIQVCYAWLQLGLCREVPKLVSSCG